LGALAVSVTVSRVLVFLFFVETGVNCSLSVPRFGSSSAASLIRARSRLANSSRLVASGTVPKNHPTVASVRVEYWLAVTQKLLEERNSRTLADFGSSIL